MEGQPDKNSSAAASNNKGKQPQGADFHESLLEIIAKDSRNFDSWTEIIEEVEEMCPDNLDIISLAYDSFLSRFPLCHWYWGKYTDHIIRLSDVHKAIEVYERALDSTPFSIGLWVDYCCFGMSFYEDPSDVRRLFKRALMFVRKDYFCHALWSEYIKFEFTQQHWGFLANIYLQVLRFPTEYLHKYYDIFKQFVEGMYEEMRKYENCRIDVEAGVPPNCVAKLSEDEISQVIEDLHNASDEAVIPKAVIKYNLIGESFYQKAQELDEKIKTFETNIQRRYFDVAPLDDEQLKNWHNYLDFIEKQDDFEWAVQLYERCLITCANYPDFWMRYVEFMESKGGRELAKSALERATQVFLKGVPEIQLFNARFQERIGDVNAADAAFINCDMGSDSSVPIYIVELANMQRRLGNLQAASDTLDEAIKMAEKKQKLHNFSSLFIHSSRLKYMITGNADAARDALIDGIQRVPHCSELLEELIKFAMTHEGAKQVNSLDSIIARAISPGSNGSPGLALKDQERISSLFMEFVDLFGTVHDVRKAWNRHIRLFPQLVRNNIVYMEMDVGNCLSDEILVQRESSTSAFPNLLNEVQQNNQLVEEQVSAISLNHASKGEFVSADQSPQECCNTECERKQHLSTQFENELTFASSEVNEVTQDLMLELADDTPEAVELNDNLSEQHKANVTAPMEITPTSVCCSNEGTSVPDGLTSNFNCQSREIATLESAQEHSYPIKMQDQKLKQHPNPVSFDNISFNSQKKASRDSTAMTSDEHDATLDISMSTYCLNGNIPINIPNSTADTDSVEVQECSYGTKLATLFCSATRQQNTATKAHPNSLVPPSTSGECCQMLKGTVPEVETSFMCLYAQDLQHQHQQSSTFQQNPTVELVSKMPNSSSYPQRPLVWKQADQTQVHCKEGAAQENIATNHVWPVNNMPNMSSSSTNVSHMTPPLVSCPQPNLLQYGSHSSLQPVATQHGQTLSQTLQYQQHFLQQQYQQQLVQMLSQYQQHQQSYQNQQELQPQQQQVSSWQQQQYFQQQQQLLSVPYQVQQLQQQQMPHLLQAHQQVQQHYHQSAQQLQLQHGQGQQQFPQVHEQQLQVYPQSQKHAYEMHQQGYQQLAAQAYQTLFQQCQMYQQGYGQMLQQHQQQQYQYNQMVLQQPPQHQKQEDEQQGHHQQKSSNTDLSQGISQHLQGQQNAPEGSDSELFQHLSPQSMAQLDTERQFGQAASSHKEPSQGKSPSYDIDSPESAASSHHGQ
ncbi:hypothetical protein ACH5RR_018340 [Cinchona calisaya]|uniref:Pre-mRNA-processing factor 39 n=1 Tax=Cinchona calisaya TaxID=153742 RepID=A0ABD2ZL53_9GENT